MREGAGDTHRGRGRRAPLDRLRRTLRRGGRRHRRARARHRGARGEVQIVMRQLASLGVLVAFCCATVSAADRPYEFGVLPYLPLAKIQELYGPISADFEA